MTKLAKFLRKLKEEEKSSRRTLRHSNPANGIEYNKINSTYLVSKNIWKVDLARTPQVVRAWHNPVDMHGEAWLANKYNLLVNYRVTKVHGRGR